MERLQTNKTIKEIAHEGTGDISDIIKLANEGTAEWINSIEKWERWTGNNKCPHCGGAEIEYNTQITLTSYPPQSQLRCKDCGHIFSSGFGAEWTNKDALDKLFEHDQSILGTPQVGDWPPAPTPCDPIGVPQQLNYGWICPKCGRCLAPHVDSCPHCNNYPRGLRANTSILDDAMDADLKDIIYGNGLKNADTYKTDSPGIYKEK